MELLRIFLILLCVLSAGACSKQSLSNSDIPEGKVQVRIGQSIDIKTRTSIADDGTTAIWTGGDRIALWAVDGSGTNALEGEVFKMCHYDSTKSTAVFTANITPMAEGVYTYYASYPAPKSVVGTTAVYTLAQEQNAGSFNGDCDIMVSQPVEEAGALSEQGVNNLDFRFSHKMHVLKVKIPVGGNALGMPITRLEFEFATEVTGDVEIDVTNPLAPATLTNGSKRLILDIPEGVDEGGTAWGMIFPTDISGEVTYTAYSDGYASFPKTIAIAKNAEPSHISPMSIEIPELYRMTEISLSIGANNLGEDIRSFSIINEGGNTIKTFTANEQNEYIIAFEGEFDPAPYSGKTFTARFESDNAIIDNTFTLPTITPYIKNTVAEGLVVPWLFEEDFSGVEQLSSNDNYATSSTGSKSGVSFLSGWSGARFGAQAGTAIRLASRRETSANYSARVDSAPLTNLKADASAKVEITFNYAMDRKEGGIGSAPNVGQTCYLGSTTDSSVLSSGSDTGTFVANFNINESGYGYDNIPHETSFVIEGAAATTRITWRTVSDSKSGLTNGTYWLYIDNVKARIVK